MINRLKRRIRDQCYYCWKSIKEHWLHAILGLTAIVEGIILILNNQYFIYPPYLQQEMNNDLVGLIAILFGYRLIKWCVDNNRTSVQNRNLLIIASAFFAFISVAEIIQCFAPNCSPHVIMASAVNFALLVITFNLASVKKDQ